MKKSMVKMHGVKTVYHVSKGVNVVTAFGRGNDSVLDKRITGLETRDLRQDSDILIGFYENRE